MALASQKISIPFAAGIDDASDPKQNPPGSLEKLENATFDKRLAINKRNGFKAISKKLLDNTSISGAQFLTRYNDRELNLFTLTDFYAYSESVQKWTSKGNVYSVYPTSNSVLRNDYEQKNIDCASIENLNIFCYEDSTGVRVSIIDSQNDHTLLSNELISASGTTPKLAQISNLVYVLYRVSGEIRFKTINPLNPTEISSEVTAVNDILTSNAKFDAVGAGQRVYVGYGNTSNELTYFYISDDNSISSKVIESAEDPSNAITMFADSATRIWAVYSDGSDVKVNCKSFTLGVNIVSPTSLETIGDINNVTIVETTTGNYDVYYEYGPSLTSVSDHYVKLNTVDLSGTVGTPTILKRSVNLASKAFYHQEKSHVVLVHDSTLQATYFLCDQNGNLLSKISPGLAGGQIVDNGLPNIPPLSDDSFLFASQKKGRITVENEEFDTLLGVNSTVLDFEIARPYQNAQLGDSLLIAGGIVNMYDGRSVVEHNFHLFPEDLSAASAATGGVLSDGVRQYTAVYAWTDNNGNIHRSAPAVATEVTLSGGGSNQDIDITVPTLRLTQKENVIIELYGTEAAGTVFYKISDTSSPTYNDPTIDSVTINVDVTDSNLISREILYTTGGLLDNIAAPACRLIERWQDRIFLGGLENENEIQYSKIRFAGTPIEFNDTLTLSVDSIGGRITAYQKMDDKILIFKNDACFFLSGDGPNNLGQQDSFIIPQLISSEVGCVDPNSTVLTPFGVMFKSKKGIFLVDRGLRLSYIGSAVESFNNEEVTSALVVPDENEVRFTTKNSNCLVYNYNQRKWATYTNFQALSATLIDSDYYYLRKDGTIYKENPGSFSDNGSVINMSVTTDWISFADIQGFQRVKKLFLLGDFKSDHNLRVQIAYDFNEAFVQERVIDVSDFTYDQKYGESSPYGDQSVYGGNGNVYQLRLDLKRQKCQAVKIKITEIQSAPAEDGMTLSNIAFELGIKQGLNKLGSNRQFGSE